MHLRCASATLLLFTACQSPRPLDLPVPLEILPKSCPQEYEAQAIDAVIRARVPDVGVDSRTIGNEVRTTEERFMTGPSKQVLQDLVRDTPGLTPPVGHALVFEQLPSRSETGLWRTHCVATAGISLRRLTDARVSASPDAPGVQLALAPGDAEAFHAMTRERVGLGIAFVHGDEVISAPVVMEPIPGGKITLAGDASLLARLARLAP